MEERKDEINYTEMIAKLWKKRKCLILWTAAGFFFGIFMAATTPKSYEVETVMVQETETKMGSGVSSIASMMGVNIDNSTDAINGLLFPDVLSSTPFIFGLLDTPIKTSKGVETDYLDYVLSHKKAAWWQVVMGLPGRCISGIKSLFVKRDEPKFKKGDHIDISSLDIENPSKLISRVIKGISSSITFVEDKKSGKISITVTEQDPLVAKIVSEEIISDLTDYMIKYRTSKTSQDVLMLTSICEERKAEYYAAQKAYAKYMDSNKSIILQSAQAERERLQQEMNLAYQIYSQVATQLETARIKEQTSKPVFAIIEPAKVPVRKSAPSMAKFAILFSFLFFCGAAAYLLFWDTAKSKIAAITNDLQQ